MYAKILIEDWTDNATEQQTLVGCDATDTKERYGIVIMLRDGTQYMIEDEPD